MHQKNAVHFSPYPRFAEAVKHNRRHVLTPDQRRVLDLIVATSAPRRKHLASGTLLWRARLGHDGYGKFTFGTSSQRRARSQRRAFYIEKPYPVDGMKPLADRAKEGRVNPKGIPCLYCSTDRDTAMSEIRPWIGSYVTVAEFMTTATLSIVDCAADRLSVLGRLVFPTTTDKLCGLI